MRASAPVRKIILIWKNLPFWVCVAKLRTNFLLATRHRILGNSLLFTRYSLFFACYLLLFVRYLLLFTNYSLIFTRYLFLFTRYPLLFTFYPLIFTRYSFLFTRYLLLLTRYLLLAICYSLRFTPRYYLLVTRHYFLMFSVDDNNHQPHDIQVHNFIQELRGKNAQSQHFESFLIKETITKNFPVKSWSLITPLKKDFKILIFRLPMFFTIKIFQSRFVNFEDYKVQSFRKCTTWYTCCFKIAIKSD